MNEQTEVKTIPSSTKGESRLSMAATLLFLASVVLSVLWIHQCSTTSTVRVERDGFKGKLDAEQALTTRLYRVIEQKKQAIDSLTAIVTAGTAERRQVEGQIEQLSTLR